MGKRCKALSAAIWILTSILIFFGYIIGRGLIDDERHAKLFFPLVICGLIIGILFVYKCSFNIHIMNYAPAIYIVGLISMVLIQTPVGLTINGSRRWLGWNGFRIVRPAEWFFLSTIIILAYWFDKKNRLSKQSEIDSVGLDWRSAISRNLGTVFLIVTILFLIIYDGFISIVLGVIVFAFFVEIMYETNVHKRVSKIILWILISVITLIITNSSFFYWRSYQRGSKELLTELKREAFQKAGLFGSPVPDADSIIDYSCITIQRIGVFGFLLYTLIFLVLIGMIFFIFRNAKKQKDLWGMIVTGGIAVHFVIILVLFVITNVFVTNRIIGPLFDINKSFNNMLYIIEIIIVQGILVKNSKCLSEKE